MGRLWTGAVLRMSAVVGWIVIGLASCRSDAASARPSESTDRGGAQATGNDRVGAGTDSTSAPGRRKRVVLLGTSLTAGLGLDPDKAYPALLQRKADSAGFVVTNFTASWSGMTPVQDRTKGAWSRE